MMRWIVGTSLRYRFLAVAAALALLVLGGNQVRGTSVDVFPEFAPPKVEVQTACIGLSAAEVEELITVPLEQNLQGVPELDVVRSKSVTQLSSIELIFEPGTDLMEARQLVQERVSSMASTLPSWAAPPVIIQPKSATSRIMKIGLSSDELTPIDLSMTAYWNVRARLLGVPGVANVAIWGQRKQLLNVNVDPARLERKGVTLEETMTVASNALDAGLLKYTGGTLVGTGGAVETPNQRIGVRHNLPVFTSTELGKVVVKGSESGGDAVTLRDVADVETSHQPLNGDAVINDGEGLMLIVEKLPWANTLEVTEGVEEVLEQLEPGLPGVEVDSTIFRPATFIEIAIDNLTSALFLGALLVVVILLLFLFEWRSAVISAVAIPLSLLGALTVMDIRNTTVNTMVLAGLVIAVGVVVDDAIIDIENIVRRLRQHRAEGGSTTVPCRPRGVGGGAQRDHLRHVDQRRGGRAGVLPRRAHRCLLPAARAVVLPGRAGLDGHRAHRDPGPGPAPAGEGPAGSAAASARARASARLRGNARLAVATHAGPRRRFRLPHPRRDGRRARAGQLAAPGLQGARLPHALADHAGHLAPRDGPHHDPGQQGAAQHRGRAQLRCAHRPGGQRRRGGRHVLR